LELWNLLAFLQIVHYAQVLCVGEQLAGFGLGSLSDQFEEHLLHKVCFLDRKHFLEQLCASGTSEVFEQILAMLKHEPQKINIIIHLE
jgi:hypothetical protein